MKRKNATRSALFTSIISLLLCVSMLVGTTFAWFTDSVVSGTNVIAAGNLDVELLYSKTQTFDPDQKVDGQTLLFTDKNDSKIEHWEPGVIAYSNFQVANVGTLALTYRMSLVFDNMNTVTYNGQQYDLSNVLKVAIVEDGFAGDRAAAQDLDFDYTLDSFHLEGELEGGKNTETFGVVIYWEPGANEYDNIFNLNNGRTADDGSEELKVDLGINLFATQEEYEYDSFDDQYDKEADMIVAAGETLTYEGETFEGLLENNGSVEITGSTMTNDGTILTNNGEATITDTKMEMTSGTGYIANGRGDDSVTVFENVDATSTGGGINVWEGEAVFKSGTVTTNSTSTSGRHVFYVADGATLTIEDGEFTFSPTNLTRKGFYICAQQNATVYVKGGNFGKPSTRTNSSPSANYVTGIYADETSKVIITGGTFKFDPTKWVPVGYQAVLENGTWTVVKLDQAAANADLKEAIDSGAAEINVAAGTYTFPASSLKAGQTLNCEPGTVFEGGTGMNINGATVVGATFSNPGGTAGTSTVNGTYKDCVFDGQNGLRWCYAGDKVVFENCVFSGDVYGVHFDGGANEVLFKNCTLSGFNAMGGAITKLTMEGCTFKPGRSAYNGINLWGNTEMIDCTFVFDGTKTEWVDLCTSNLTGTFTNCVVTDGTTETPFENVLGNYGDNNFITIDGVVYAWDAASLAKALTSDAKDITVTLMADVEGNFGHSSELGGAATETVTINGNGHKLTLTKDYMPGFWLANDAAKLVINDATITAVRDSGTWDIYDINFDNDTELNKVTFEKAVSLSGVGNTYVLKDVTISETHDYYALWISAKGQNVEIDGLTVNSTGRGIKIDEQYVGTPAKVTLKLSNATFNTGYKAAVLVKSAAGADITLDNVDITNVAADSTNVVWVDEDAAAYADLVTVTGGSVIVEP